MGPHNFHRDFIGRKQHEKMDGKRQSQLKDLKGKIGVDASAWFHRCIHTTNGAAVFDMVPKVPLLDAFSTFMSTLKSLLTTRENGVKDVILFLDGRSHPLKKANEGKRREESVKNALNSLRLIYEHGDVYGSYNDVKKLRKLIATRREDFTTMVVDECHKIGVKVFCAPFEADWQLVEAQKAGFIDYILSDDGDVFVIGGDHIITDVDYATGECCFYERNKIMQRESMGSGSYVNHLPVLSNLLGNDYIDRLDGNGPVTVRNWMSQFINARDDVERRQVLEQLKLKKWNADDTNNASDYPEKFWRAYHLQVLPPVFRLKPNASCESGIDLDNEDSFNVVLEPLNNLPVGVSLVEWGRMIGFGETPSKLLKGEEKELLLFKASPETGSPPARLEQPRSEYEPHYEVAHGANPDVTKPVEYWADWALRTFLNERGLPLRGRYKRDECIRLVRRVLSLMKKQGSRFTQPKVYDPNQQQTSYDEEEPLTVSEDGGRFVWDGDWETFTKMLLEIDELGDEDFFAIFGEGRNGIQDRARKLIVGGNFDVGKIQTAKCRIKSNGNNAIAIRIECVPSMKSEPYWAMLVVDRTTNKLIPAPTSRCGCPAGLGGCSHLRGEYAILFYIQKLLRQRQQHLETLTQNDVVSLLPPAMSTMKKVPIPFNYAFRDDAAEKELKKEKRRKELRNKETTNLLFLLNSGAAIGGDDSNDEDSLDENFSDKDCSDSESSIDFDEEALLELQDDANVLDIVDRDTKERCEVDC